MAATKSLALLNDLRAALIEELPKDSQPLTDALAARDLILANVNLVTITNEKAAASAEAGEDVDALHPLVREAYINVARAKAAAAYEETVKAAEVAAEAALAAETAALTEKK